MAWGNQQLPCPEVVLSRESTWKCEPWFLISSYYLRLKICAVDAWTASCVWNGWATYGGELFGRLQQLHFCIWPGRFSHWSVKYLQYCLNLRMQWATVVTWQMSNIMSLSRQEVERPIQCGEWCLTLTSFPLTAEVSLLVSLRDFFLEFSRYLLPWEPDFQSEDLIHFFFLSLAASLRSSVNNLFT